MRSPPAIVASRKEKNDQRLVVRHDLKWANKDSCMPSAPKTLSLHHWPVSMICSEVRLECLPNTEYKFYYSIIKKETQNDLTVSNQLPWTLWTACVFFPGSQVNFLLKLVHTTEKCWRAKTFQGSAANWFLLLSYFPISNVTDEVCPLC